MKKNNQTNIDLNCYVKRFFDSQNKVREKKLRKDFMNLLAHEIKTPLSVTLFHVDDLILDLEEWKEFDREKIKEKLIDTEMQLEKISILVNNIFQSQKNDIWNIVLNKENTDLWEWLCQELKCFQNRYKDIEFIINISENIRYYEFDMRLMSQVISNIIWNAIKFSDKKWKKILIESFLLNGYIYIDIEDNWNGFSDISNESLFNKYKIWNEEFSWIWIWLYLSDVIVWKHWWEINILNAENLKWAKVRIVLKK